MVEKNVADKPNVEKEKIKLIIRVASKDLDGKRPLRRALWKIRGISHMFSNAILKVSTLDPNRELGSLSKEEITKLEHIMENPREYGIPDFLLNRRKDPTTGKPAHISGPKLEITNKFDIRGMQEIRSRKGIRHTYGLKVRGQRTSSTGRKSGTIGVRRKKTAAKASAVQAKKESKPTPKKK